MAPGFPQCALLQAVLEAGAGHHQALQAVAQACRKKRRMPRQLALEVVERAVVRQALPGQVQQTSGGRPARRACSKVSLAKVTQGRLVGALLAGAMADAATTSWDAAQSAATTCRPMKPVAPVTAILTP